MSESPPLRLAMLGMIPGNGHPYSWSAIINGYNPEEMARCAYPAIRHYLGAQPRESVRIPGVQVTHIWTDDPQEAPHVAAASLIPHVVDRPEAVIGEVDAVLIATDDGDDHVRRAAPFVEAGLPVFIDKPMATNVDDLRQFIAWRKAGARIQSSSGMRYMVELDALRGEPWLWITATTPKSWKRYGIHILEPVLTLLGPGFTHARAEHAEASDIVYLRHRSGTQVTLAAIEKAVGSFGVFHAYGATGHRAVQMKDTYTAFRRQLLAFVEFVRTGQDSFPFADTVELMAAIIAGRRSGEQDGRLVAIDEIKAELPNL